MNNFFQDLDANLSTYYENLVALVPRLVLASLIFLVTYLISRSLKKMALKRLSGQMDDPLLAKFISKLAFTVLLVVGFLIVLRILGLGGVAIGLLSTAGLGAFVLGFAFKDIGENFLAGMVMAFNRPFRVGDIVELNGHKGQIITLNLRDTQIKTFDGKDIYMPNAMVVKNPVINFTIDGYIRQEIQIGLDYSSNISEAIRIVLEMLREVRGVERGDKSPSVIVSDISGQKITLTAYYWLNTFDRSISGLEIKNDVVQRTLNALSDEGFYLPAEIVELKSYRDSQMSFISTSNQDNTIQKD